MKQVTIKDIKSILTKMTPVTDLPEAIVTISPWKVEMYNPTLKEMEKKLKEAMSSRDSSALAAALLKKKEITKDIEKHPDTVINIQWKLLKVKSSLKEVTPSNSNFAIPTPISSFEHIWIKNDVLTACVESGILVVEGSEKTEINEAGEAVPIYVVKVKGAQFDIEAPIYGRDSKIVREPRLKICLETGKEWASRNIAATKLFQSDLYKSQYVNRNAEIGINK